MKKIVAIILMGLMVGACLPDQKEVWNKNREKPPKPGRNNPGM